MKNMTLFVQSRWCHRQSCLRQPAANVPSRTRSSWQDPVAPHSRSSWA